MKVIEDYIGKKIHLEFNLLSMIFMGHDQNVVPFNETLTIVGILNELELFSSPNLSLL